MPGSAALTEAQVVRALRRLERGWPEGYKLHAGTGSLILLGPDHYADADLRLRVSAVVESFAISCDGGDPEWDHAG